MRTLAIRFDYGGSPICQTPEAVEVLAQLLGRPCFARFLSRVSARRPDRCVAHTPMSRALLTEILLDPRNEGARLDSGRSGELVASAEIQSGPMVRPKGPPASRYMTAIAIPFVAEDLEHVIGGMSDLAMALEAVAGFVALEPSFALAHRIALGGTMPRQRTGLSTQRIRERLGRDFHDELLHVRASGIEWMTVLGPGHMAVLASAGIDPDRLRTAGEIHRWIDVVAGQRAIVQLTEDPTADLDDPHFEHKRDAVTALLQPIMLDLRDVCIDP